jgi:hypothetical protein
MQSKQSKAKRERGGFISITRKICLEMKPLLRDATRTTRLHLLAACEPREFSPARDRHAARCFFTLYLRLPVPRLAVIARVAVGQYRLALEFNNILFFRSMRLMPQNQPLFSREIYYTLP